MPPNREAYSGTPCIVRRQCLLAPDAVGGGGMMAAYAEAPRRFFGAEGHTSWLRKDSAFLGAEPWGSRYAISSE